MSTARTLLRSVSSINVFNRLTSQDRFVLQESFELEPRPTSQDAVELASVLFVFPDVQLFQNKSVKWQCNYLFADAMVGVPDEAVILSTNLLEKTTSGLCAFALEFTSKILVLAFDVAEMFRVKELIVRENADVFTSSVYSENLSSCLSNWFCFFNEDGEIPFVFVRFVLEFTGSSFCIPVSIRKWVSNDTHILSAVNGTELDRCISEGAGVPIEPDGWILTTLRLFGGKLPFGLCFDGLEDLHRAEQTSCEGSSGNCLRRS
jgi:hypothetical protein